MRRRPGGTEQPRGGEEKGGVGRKRKEEGGAAPGLQQPSTSRFGKRQRLEGEDLGRGVREAIYEEIAVGRKSTRFGVVSVGTPFWEWAVPAGGQLVWIWGSGFGNHVCERLGRDMFLEETTGMESLAPVDVVLFEGGAPHSTHAVWSVLETVKVIVWFGGNRRCRPPLSLSSSDVSWSVERSTLHHGALGE